MSKDKKDSWLPWVLGGLAIGYLIEKHRGLKIFVAFIGMVISIWFAIWIFSNIFGPNPPQYFRGAWTNTEYAFDDESANAFIRISYTKIKLFDNSDALFGKKVKWKYDGNTDSISFIYKDKYNFKITPISFNGDVYLDDHQGHKESFADVLQVEINGAVLFFRPTVDNDADPLNDGQKTGKYPKPKNIFAEIDAGNEIVSVNPNTKEEYRTKPHAIGQINEKVVLKEKDNLQEEYKPLINPLFGDLSRVDEEKLEGQKYVRQFVLNYNQIAPLKIDKVEWKDNYFNSKATIYIGDKSFEIDGDETGYYIKAIFSNGKAMVNEYKSIFNVFAKVLDPTITDAWFSERFEKCKNRPDINHPFIFINDNVGLEIFYHDYKSPSHDEDSYQIEIMTKLMDDPTIQSFKDDYPY